MWSQIETGIRAWNQVRFVRALCKTGLALLILQAVNVARADWRLDLETAALYDSNLSNSDRADDAKDDFAWQSDFQIGNGLQLTRDLRVSFAAELREQVWARFDAFNNLAPGGTVALRYRFGLGRLAPWVLVEDRLAYAFFKEDTRSGLDNGFRVKGGFGITDRVALEATYTFDDFDAEESFWNRSGHSGAIRVTFDATASLQVAVGYSYRYGEVFSYALPPRPDIVAIAAETDSVSSFGNPPYTAYRLRAATQGFSASVGYALGKFVAVQVNYEFRYTSRDPHLYENHLVEGKVSFSY